MQRLSMKFNEFFLSVRKFNDQDFNKLLDLIVESYDQFKAKN